MQSRNSAPPHDEKFVAWSMSHATLFARIARIGILRGPMHQIRFNGRGMKRGSQSPGIFQCSIDAAKLLVVSVRWMLAAAHCVRHLSVV
jgi:hypothetical protein